MMSPTKKKRKGTTTSHRSSSADDDDGDDDRKIPAATASSAGAVVAAAGDNQQQNNRVSEEEEYSNAADLIVDDLKKSGLLSLLLVDKEKNNNKKAPASGKKKSSDGDDADHDDTEAGGDSMINSNNIKSFLEEKKALWKKEFRLMMTPEQYENVVWDGAKKKAVLLLRSSSSPNNNKILRESDFPQEPSSLGPDDQKSQNEKYLSDISKVLNSAKFFGGGSNNHHGSVSSMIVEYVRDILRLDTLARLIKNDDDDDNSTITTMTANEVCMDLHTYTCETVCEAALSKLWDDIYIKARRNSSEGSTNAFREPEASKNVIKEIIKYQYGLDCLFVESMIRHPSNATIQSICCQFMTCICYNKGKKQEELIEHPVMRLLVSQRFVKALHLAMKVHMDNPAVLSRVLAVFHNIEQGRFSQCQRLEEDYNLTEDEQPDRSPSFTVLLQQMEDLGTVGLCFEALERHPSNAGVVSGALTVLGFAIGGNRRPCLKRYVRENNPRARQILDGLSRPYERDEHGIHFPLHTVRMHLDVF